MHGSRRIFILGLAALGACASVTTNVRRPLGAMLSSSAKTGAPIPLRFDPTAKVVMASAANLPAATFLPSQAERGREVYNNSCGVCHQPGQLIGQGFVEQWNDRRVYDFFSLVRSSMPVDNPGGMKEDEYLAVVAYLIQANHGKAGPDSLKADTTVLRNKKIAVSYP